jgi:FkbM family methyltransferase
MVGIARAWKAERAMKSIVRKAARELKRRLRAIRPRRSIRIAGKRYAIPSARNCLLNLDPEHEPWLDAVFEAALQTKAGAFVDVGVNQGQTLAKMLRIAPGNRYIGLEPQPGCVFAVDEFLRVNRLENCVILPIGLSDDTGLAELSLHSFAPGDTTASIAKAHRPDSFYVQSRLIPVFAGDEVFSQFAIDAISLITIDVEGAELEVLEGLTATLSKHRPFVVFEVLNNYLAATLEALPDETVAYRNERARRISSYFKDAGYSLFNIRSASLIALTVIVPEVSADQSIWDYLAVPDELVGEIERLFDVS